MKRIVVEFIPQGDQRYPTVGDYSETEDSIEFRITEFANPAYSMAILIHELHEKFRNDQLGIKDVEVDKFDMEHLELDEPGLCPEAPYHVPHMEADALERLSIILTGNDWVEYEKAVKALF